MNLFFKLIEISNKLKAILQGKKTTILAISTICLALVAWANGEMSTQAAAAAIIGALGAMTLHAGQTNAVKKAVDEAKK